MSEDDWVFAAAGFGIGLLIAFAWMLLANWRNYMRERKGGDPHERRK